jgi:hypothetical protein
VPLAAALIYSNSSGGAKVPNDTSLICKSEFMKNPYLRALVYVTILCGLVSLALYCVAWILVGRAGPEPGHTGLAQVIAANDWLRFFGFSLLATLVIGGVVWRSPADRARDASLQKAPRYEPTHGEDD